MEHAISSFKDTLERFLHSPFAFQAISLAFFLFFVSGFRPYIGNELFTDVYESRVEFPLAETGFLRNAVDIDSTSIREVVVNEDGEEVVTVKQIAREKTIFYTVRSGDNISKIAHKFGLKVSTLLWANDLTAKESLPLGEELKIPPSDGVFYAVKKADTLGRIAKIHSVDLNVILNANGLNKNSILAIGKELFIPAAKKIYIPTTVVKNKPVSKPKTAKGIGTIGYKFIRPSKGVITQGYHKGHYALDIASKLNTPIYAAAAGKVIKSSNGWNYGFGKRVIVDHGDGVETLYAHLNSRKVSVGDSVEAGQLIGLMGNTGNVYGPTGIHLHFELRIRGRKVNPWNYF